LKGDTSDNIPGVPGIGDKTAAQLLQEFGDLETVLASVDRISGAKRKENLVNHAEDARVSKELATSIRDVEVDIDLEECVAAPIDRSRIREVFRRFELRDPLRRLEETLAAQGAEEPGVAPTDEPQIEVRPVPVTAAELADLAGEAATLATQRPDEPMGRAPLGFAAYAGGEKVLIGDAESLGALAFAWGERPLTAHDWKSQLAAALRDGECDTPPLEHDTMVAAYLLDPAARSFPLDELAEARGIRARVATNETEPDAEGLMPLGEQAVITRALADVQRVALAEEGLERLFREVELPLVEVLADMQSVGISLDTERLAAISVRAGEETAALEREVHELAGEEFTIGSPQQLSEVLFGKLGLSKKRRGKTGFSTDARVLAAIRDEHPIVEKVETWRELSKLASTYLDALPDLLDPRTGRLHTTFNQVATTTGRLSSTNPNLQNVPIRTELGREIRACFVAGEGARLISADYSQVELRVLAHIAGEGVLKEIFERGEDVHAATAAEILGLPRGEVDPGLRSKAKMVNFGIVYGLSAYGLADRLQMPQEEAAEFIERYLDRFPKVREFIDATIAEATEKGHVRTLFGRIRRIPELKARQRQTRLLGERLAVNTVIQGSAADIIKVAMVRCHSALHAAGLATRVVLQIHDELLFEAPEKEVEEASAIVVREMAGAFPLDPPLGVDVGDGVNWLDAK